MKDRTPTQVLPNGAIRYEEFNESEVSQGYKYLKLADEPTEVGTALNKAFGDASFFVTFAHARIGTNNELTNADGGENIRFVVSANTEATDTWTVNGTSYTLKDQSGETYEAELKAGAIVSCFADNTNHVLNFKSGGAGLNFALKPYATEAALLADTPKENTIGIVTEAAITDYMFSATQPTTRSDGTALSGGEVWVKVGYASPAVFNYFKKNCAMSYPISAYQYTGEAWVSKISMAHQNGAWKKFNTYIYNGAYTPTIGTGLKQGSSFASGASTKSTTQSASSWNIKAKRATNESNDLSNYLQSCELIDVTPYSTLSMLATAVEITGTQEGDNYFLGLIAADMGYTYEASTSFKTAANSVISLDVSGISGSFYVGASCSKRVPKGYEQMDLTVYEVYLL